MGHPGLGAGRLQRIPFDFAQGGLSCLAALARWNDRGEKDGQSGMERVSSLDRNRRSGSTVYVHY